MGEKNSNLIIYPEIQETEEKQLGEPVFLSPEIELPNEMYVDYDIDKNKEKTENINQNDYAIRMNSKGKEIKIRLVKVDDSDLTNVKMKNYITQSEIKIRSKSLAYAEFKIYRKEINKKLINSRVNKLKVTILSTIFYLKLLHRARNKINMKNKLLERKKMESEYAQEEEWPGERKGSPGQENALKNNEKNISEGKKEQKEDNYSISYISDEGPTNYVLDLKLLKKVLNKIGNNKTYNEPN